MPASRRNPSGITIVDSHLRRIKGTYLDRAEIESVFKSHVRTGIVWPTAGRLRHYKGADLFDELIATWTDYFNKKLSISPPFDPDVFKALLASESGFRLDPAENKSAFGIAQITKATLRVLQDPTGEAQSFVFRNVRQRDLKDPSIAIPLATRWLCRKHQTASGKLGRAPSPEELILEYKGLLKSRTPYKEKALKSFTEAYEALKKK